MKAAPSDRVALSGWCNGPVGARPKHEHCRAEVCGCQCHEADQ